MSWTMARRAERLNPSTIREILKITERPGIISLAGGLPSTDTFPIAAMQEATARVLRDTPPGGTQGGLSSARTALQYAASEGYAPLREWVAREMSAQGVQAAPDQVLITTGSQQGLDLVGKVLIDPGSTVAVESPTYLGALQAFAPYEPEFLAIEGDDDGPLPEALDAAGGGLIGGLIGGLGGSKDGSKEAARFVYLLPNFQNPTGRCVPAARRLALVQRAAALGLPIVEDNPYGDLWFDAPPPPPLSASAQAAGADALYLGSFSKVLAPGLRLGYLVAPKLLYPKLLQAKQAADLHTPGFNQRVVYEVIKDGFLRDHVPTIRKQYKAQRDAMRAALEKHLPSDSREDGDFACHWKAPVGGMFFWLTLPPHVDATALLPKAVAAGVAYVPGATFFPHGGHANTLRLSFVTVPPATIEVGVAALARVLKEAAA